MNFQGKLLFQATKQHLNNREINGILKEEEEERERCRLLIYFWLSCFIMSFWCPAFGRLSQKAIIYMMQPPTFLFCFLNTFLFKIFSKSTTKLRLNSWNTKYLQNVTCVCKNILSVNYFNVLLPQSYFRKMDMTSMLATT